MGTQPDGHGDEGAWGPKDRLGNQAQIQHLSEGVRVRPELRRLDASPRMGKHEQPGSFPEVLSLQAEGRSRSLRVGSVPATDPDPEPSFLEVSNLHVEMLSLLGDTQKEIDDILTQANATLTAEKLSPCREPMDPVPMIPGPGMSVDAVETLAAGACPNLSESSKAPGDPSSGSLSPEDPKSSSKVMFGKSLRKRMFQTSRILQKKNSHIARESEKALQQFDHAQVDAVFASVARHKSDSKGIDLLEVFAYPKR